MTNEYQDESFRNLFDSVARDIRIHVSILVLTHKNKRLFASATPDALGLWGEAEFGELKLLMARPCDLHIDSSWVPLRNVRVFAERSTR